MNTPETKQEVSTPVMLGRGSSTRLKDLAIALLPQGGNMSACSTCGICASGCPASGLGSMDPRKFVRMIALGMDDELLASDWVWMCTTCNRCVHACPMKVDIPQLVLLIRSRWPDKKRPKGIVDYCRHAVNSDTGSNLGISTEDWRLVVEDVLDDVRENQKGFEALSVPVDREGADFFLNQISGSPLAEPEEMPPLWKIMFLAGVDWTYGSKGWASENYCMFLGDNDGWRELVRAKADTVETLGCKVLLNTECGHDYLAVSQGLVKFNIPHSFRVENIIRYYAEWIRTGRLKVNSDWNLDLKIGFTVQDPCQLVRKGYGDSIADELRYVVKAAVGEENFIDMYPNRSNNYCCGGGGGAMQSDFQDERRHYGKIKLEQILETGAAYCVTPCNNCHNQILDLSRHYGAGFRTIHLWTLLCLAMGVLGENERKYLGQDLSRIGL